MGAFIDYLDARFSLEHVSGGSQVKVGGACPFCGESRADLRMYVSVATEVGVCFHCNQGFTAVKFVMANEECGYRAALKILNGDEDGFLREVKAKEKEIPLVVPKTIPIHESAAALEYVRGRGLTDALIEHFGLRYSKWNVEIDGRLFKTKGRVIIPVNDMTGKMVSWQGRDITGRFLRYLFPPGFRGAHYLYNIDRIPVRPDYLIVSEGVFDAFGWWRAGAKNVVATFGKKISEPQVDMLRYLKPGAVFIAWDSDASWEKYEFMERWGYLFDIRFVELGGKDADEMEKGALVSALSTARRYSWSDKILSSRL